MTKKIVEIRHCEVPLIMHPVVTEVLIQADPNNDGIVYIGNADSQSTVLDAGGVKGISIDEMSKVCVRGSVERQRILVLVRVESKLVPLAEPGGAAAIGRNGSPIAEMQSRP